MRTYTLGELKSRCRLIIAGPEMRLIDRDLGKDIVVLSLIPRVDINSVGVLLMGSYGECKLYYVQECYHPDYQELKTIFKGLDYHLDLQLPLSRLKIKHFGLVEIVESPKTISFFIQKELLVEFYKDDPETSFAGSVLNGAHPTRLTELHLELLRNYTNAKFVRRV